MKSSVDTQPLKKCVDNYLAKKTCLKRCNGSSNFESLL
nr:hypothetical protein [Acinetobacter baumannii]